MSPAYNESAVLQRFECGNAVTWLKYVMLFSKKYLREQQPLSSLILRSHSMRISLPTHDTEIDLH